MKVSVSECWNRTATETRLCRPAGSAICLTENTILKGTGFVWINRRGSWPTFKNVLLHLNLIELVGADNDTVAGEVDTAAGLRCLYLLHTQTEVQPLIWKPSLPKAKQMPPRGLSSIEWSSGLTHLSDAELVQAFIMSQNCNLIGHSSTDTGPIINL